MKSTPLVIAALVPVVAIASEQTGTQQSVDHQQLRSHAQVTSILGTEVQSDEGRGVGTVEDIVFDKQGHISSVLVKRGSADTEADANTSRIAERSDSIRKNGSELTERDAQQNGEELAATDERDGDANYATAEIREREPDIAEVRDESRERTSREGNMAGMSAKLDSTESAVQGNALVRLQWSAVSYDAEEQVLHLVNKAASALQAVQYEQAGEEAAQDEVRASELVGLEVNLSDEKSFGEVEDIMIDAENGRASALVVDSMEFFDKERYALPVELDGLNTQDDSLTLQMTQQQVEDMGEFEMK